MGPCYVVLCTCVCHRCGAWGFRPCRRCHWDVVLNVPHLQVECRQRPRLFCTPQVLVLRLHLRLRQSVWHSKPDQQERVENMRVSTPLRPGPSTSPEHLPEPAAARWRSGCQTARITCTRWVLREHS